MSESKCLRSFLIFPENIKQMIRRSDQIRPLARYENVVEIQGVS